MKTNTAKMNDNAQLAWCMLRCVASLQTPTEALALPMLSANGDRTALTVFIRNLQGWVCEDGGSASLGLSQIQHSVVFVSYYVRTVMQKKKKKKVQSRNLRLIKKVKKHMSSTSNTLG